MEWSLISLIIGFDPIYSKMNHLKRVQGVLKMIFQKSRISKISRISLEFKKSWILPKITELSKLIEFL